MSAGKRTRRNWSDDDVRLLLEMVFDCERRGIRIEWRRIAASLGRWESSCNNKYHMERGRALDLEVRAAVEQRVASRQASAAAPIFSSATSTAKLVTDAELRARIAVLGVTGGLLGDPLPGRSVLDRRRAGISEEIVIDKRVAQLPRPITLATRPFR